MSGRLFEKWITNGTCRPFYARKVVGIDREAAKATAQVCGLGQFNFYINGRKVDDHVLDPAWTDYRKIVYYVEFDVTAYLKNGENELLGEVGNGWYIADDSEGYFFKFPSFMPPNPNPYVPFGKELILAINLFIEYTDGTQELIRTDESWEVAEHEVIHSNCFGSEVIDGRKKAKWSGAVISEEGRKYDDKLCRQTMPPVKVVNTYPGRYLSFAGGKSIYDFGQNTSGMLKFEVKGKAGDVVSAYPAEKLSENGDVDQMAKNWLPIDVREDYIISQDDVWETFEMKFTYFGGRYVGITADRDNIRNVELNAISSAYDNAGTFTCDDERIMSIYRLIERAVESNMVSVHTDCPTIERFAWQEENHLMAPSVMFMKNVKKHWEKFLTDTRLSQHSADDCFNDGHHGKYYPGAGLIPAQAPCYIPNVLPVPGLGDFYNVIGWGSTIILGTYWHYQFYGDRKIIEDNYASGMKYLEFLKTMTDENGFIKNGLGDWGNPTGEFAKENVETAFLYADAKYLSYFAEILGKVDDQIKLGEYALEVRDNYNRKLLCYDESSKRYAYRVFDKKDSFVVTQAAEAIPLFFGMVPDDKEKDVVESFKASLLEAGCLKTGEVAQPYIIQMMCRYGLNDLLYDMILKPEHPSYYAFVLAGETSLGEYWEENPRSHNHDMMGHIMEWFYNGIAGIRILEPGFKKVKITPYMPKGMNSFSCTYKTPYGEIRVEGHRLEGEPVFSIQVPDMIQAESFMKR